MLKKSLLPMLLGICISFSFPATVFAGSVPVIPDDIYNQIDTCLQSEFVKAHIPGSAVSIVEKDSILFEKTYGNCTDLNASFIIGSQSKSFTALAIMQLYEAGKIDLDAAINTYLPNIREGDKITVRQLLNQTSGLPVYAVQNNFTVTNAQGRHVYANANYGLLGQIISSVSGMHYEEYIETYIFKPLNMSHSFTSLKDAKSDGLMCTGYRNYFGFMVPENIAYPTADDTGWTSVAAGYLISSSADMGKYLQMYLNGGGDLLSSRGIDTLFYDHVQIEDGLYYGMGWILNESCSEPVIEHSGAVENYISYMFILPERGLAVTILTNANDFFIGNAMMEKVGDGLIQILLGSESDSISKWDYWLQHSLLNVIFLLLIVLSLLPVFFRKRWKRKVTGKLTTKQILTLLLLHLIAPAVICLLPVFLGQPLYVVRRFVPDLFWVLMFSAGILCVTGIYKLIYQLTTCKSFGY